MTTLRKSYPVQILTDGARRTRALVSVYDNVDLQGDRVVRGAFSASLEQWRASGDPLPCIFSHEWSNPLLFVGTVDPAFITDEGPGLTVEVDWDSDETAQKVAQLVHDRRVKEWSFAYDVVRERRASDGANELLELKLIECGPTLKGANPETITLARKFLGDAKPRPATRGERRLAPRKKPKQKFLVSTTHPVYGTFEPQYVYLSDLADGLAKIARDAGYPDLGEELRSIVLVDGVDDVETLKRHLSSAVTARSHRSAKCPRCGKRQELELQDPIPGGTVVWGITKCHGELLGFSSLPTEPFVREMAKVRTYVDVGLAEGAKMQKTDRNLVDQLDALDPAGAKHSPATTEAGYRAVVAAITVVDNARGRIGHLNSLIRQLKENVLRPLRLAAESLGADARDVPRAANWALGAATSMRLVAEAVRQAGYADVATDLERAAARIVESVDVLAPHQLEPPSEPLPVKSQIPTVDARMKIVGEQPAAPVVDEESFSIPISVVVSGESYRFENSTDEAPVPVQTNETFRLAEAGEVVDSTVTQVEGEGTTFRWDVEEYKRNLLDGDEFRIEER